MIILFFGITVYRWENIYTIMYKKWMCLASSSIRFSKNVLCSYNNVKELNKYNSIKKH